MTTDRLAAIDGCINIVQQSLDTVRGEDDGESRTIRASIAAREHVIRLLTGYREREAAASVTVAYRGEPEDGRPRTQAGRNLLASIAQYDDYFGAVIAIEDEAAAGVTVAQPDGLGAAYTERNAVVAALIRATGWRCWIADAPDASGWYIVYVDTPQGQVSWHFGPWDIALFGDANGAPLFSSRRDGDEWDGHTTEEKYARLAAIAREYAAAQPAPAAPMDDESFAAGFRAGVRSDAARGMWSDKAHCIDQDDLDALRVAAQAVVDRAEPDDDFDGQYIQYLVDYNLIAALRAALEQQP